MCRREEPSPGPPSCCCCFCSSRMYRLDVRGRRVLVSRPASLDATSGRLCGLWTKDGAISSASLSSLTILTSRQRLEAWLVEPWPIESCAAIPAGIASVEDGSIVIGLFLATLSSMVGAGRLWCSSLLVYWKHRAASSASGSTPAGWSIPGASDA